MPKLFRTRAPKIKNFQFRNGHVKIFLKRVLSSHGLVHKNSHFYAIVNKTFFFFISYSNCNFFCLNPTELLLKKKCILKYHLIVGQTYTFTLTWFLISVAYQKNMSLCSNSQDLPIFKLATWIQQKLLWFLLNVRLTVEGSCINLLTITVSINELKSPFNLLTNEFWALRIPFN